MPEYSCRYHPDKNKEKGAEDKFVEIAQGTFTELWLELSLTRRSLRSSVRLYSTYHFHGLILWANNTFRNVKSMIVTVKYADSPPAS